MSHSDRGRSSWWITGGLVVAVVAAVVLFVHMRLQLNEDERYLVGRWVLDGMDDPDSTIEFRPDGTIVHHFHGRLIERGARWSVRSGVIHFDIDPDTTPEWKRTWTRIIGGAPHGESSKFQVVSEDECEIEGERFRRFPQPADH